MGGRRWSLVEARREDQKVLLITRLAYLEVIILDARQIEQHMHDGHFFSMLTQYVHVQ